jgi:hypothetical protein
MVNSPFETNYDGKDNFRQAAFSGRNRRLWLKPYELAIHRTPTALPAPYSFKSHKSSTVDRKWGKVRLENIDESVLSQC